MRSNNVERIFFLKQKISVIIRSLGLVNEFIGL